MTKLIDSFINYFSLQMGNNSCPQQQMQIQQKQVLKQRRLNQSQSPDQNDSQQLICEQNTAAKTFLKTSFRRISKASKKKEFNIRGSQCISSQNPDLRRKSISKKLEEMQKYDNQKKTDFIIQKTGSVIFNTSQQQKSIQLSTGQTPSFNKQNQQILRSSGQGSSRSSFESYSRNFKPLSIKQSSFVKVKSNNFQFYYELLQKIGEGAYGTVFKARCKSNNQIRAVKILKKKILKTLNQTQKLHSQLQILKSLDHPNIIKVYDVFRTEDLYYVVTQYCSGGNLQDYLSSNSYNIDIELVKKIIKQLLGVLSYLSNESIIHRDIKLENIVFDTNPDKCLHFEDLQIKVIDFGLAMRAKHKSINIQKPFTGTPLYMAPEVLSGRYSNRSDVWSCGVLLYFLMAKEFPFKSNDFQELCDKISTLDALFQRPFWKTMDKNVVQLLQKMLQKKFLKRTTALQALNCSWLSSNGQYKRSQKQLVVNKLRQYKKQNNFITFIESYLIFSKSGLIEKKKLISLFQKIDKDQNGVIDQQQLYLLFPDNKCNSQQKQILSDLVKKIDRNKSGKIQISEFLTILCDRSKLFNEDYLKEAFDFLDVDKNGFIQKKQLMKAMDGCEAQQYEVLWKDIDINQDLRISKSQFIQYLMRQDQVEAY